MAQLCSMQTMIDTLHTKVGVPKSIPNIDTASWEELGVESLGLTEVCTSLEHTLGIVIPQYEAFTMKNARELLLFVNALQVA